MTGYDSASGTVALIDRSNRVRIELAGPDRVKVLHNLSTNDIKRLAPGRGCEAFLTNGQGRTLAFVTVHNEGDRIFVRSDPGTAGAILGHLGKYGMFEDATVRDVSGESTEWHLCGPGADDLARAAGLAPPETDLGISTGAVRVIRDDPTGRGGLTFLTRTDAEFLSALRSALDTQGGSLLDAEAFEALRIEAGTPVSGVDVTDANLPQEVNRDARAISFVKGCYLGQETVARLDALGHVNKILIGAVVEGDGVPPSGATIEAEGKAVGAITSSAFSPGWSRGVVMAYVKTAHAAPGSMLVARWEGGTCGLAVRAWPMRG